MFVFRPGRARPGAADLRRAAEGAGRASAARARFQHDLVERFPNVSVIDFREMLETIRDVMSKVTLAITVVGGLVLFSGGLILIGAVAMTKFQRVYEAAVFKTLGANTRTIARMLLFEYGVLGSLAGLIGSLGAIVLTWGVSRYALEIPWRVFAGEHVAGVRADGAARRRHRRRLEPRRPAEQAARDAASRVASRLMPVTLRFAPPEQSDVRSGRGPVGASRPSAVASPGARPRSSASDSAMI